MPIPHATDINYTLQNNPKAILSTYADSGLARLITEHILQTINMFRVFILQAVQRGFNQKKLLCFPKGDFDINKTQEWLQLQPTT